MLPGLRKCFSCALGFFFVFGLLQQSLLRASHDIPDINKNSINKAHEEFRVFYHNLLEKHGIIGSSFMLIHDNKVLAREFHGLANIEQNRKVDKDTIYHWASITKTMAGIAIMQLRDRGLLKLDDPIIQYIPELKMAHNPFGDMSAVTIRHLMTHSAGFRAPTWPWKDRKNKPWHPHEPLHWEQLVAMFPYTEVMFEPGSRFFMSNPGIIFLGRIVEVLTTDDWEMYIEKNLFKPLEMHRSYFDTTPYHLMKDKCQSYYLEEGKLEPADPDVNTGITVSNGGLKAPFGDLVKYVDFLMGHPEKQSLYDIILKRSSLEEMWKPQLPIEDLEIQHRGQGRVDAIGLTFYLEKNFGMDFVAHRGQQNAFVTHFFLNPDSRTAYIVGFNTVADDAEHNTAIVDIEIKDYLFEHIFPLFRVNTED